MKTCRKTKQIQEKRAHHRKNLLINCDYVSGDCVRKDFADNISAGGAFIEMANPIEVKQEISLVFPLSGGEENIKIIGEVVRTSPQGVGVKFKNTISASLINSIFNNIKASIKDKAARAGSKEQSKIDIIRHAQRRNQLAFILPNLCGQLTETMLRHIESQAEWVHLRKGEVLLRQGKIEESMYVLVSGRLQAVREDEEGREHTLGEIARGECVGEMSLFTGEARSATIYAIRDSYLVKFTKPAFENIAERHPQVMVTIAKILINRLGKTIRSPSADSTVTNFAVVFISQHLPRKDFTMRLVKALSAYGTTLHLNSDTLDWITGIPGAAQAPENSPYSIQLSTWLDEQETRYDFVIYEADEACSNWTNRCIRMADHVLLVAQAKEDPVQNGVQRALKSAESDITTARRSLILVYPLGHPAPTGTSRWLEEWKVGMHHHLRWDTDEDFGRLARFLTGRAVGLVLGGGGARGLAHIGVIRALREEGIPIDMIGGTSIGAIIASAYAMGLDYEHMHEMARKNFVDTNPFSDYTLPIISLSKSKKLDSIARRFYGDINIEDLWLNFFCISSNLTTAEEIVHRRGPLWKAARSSASIPGIAVPVLYGNNLLVDGGILNNLPGDIMRSISGGSVIAVDVSAEKELTFDYDRMFSSWEVLLNKVILSRKSFNVPTILDVLGRITMISSISKINQIKKEMDVYLRIPLSQFKMMDFSSIDEIVDLGYRYTKEKTGEIKEEISF
ncbi:MAG TPA: patatin-like phospholipase family protein [archaeon]|nr:patatin-like phospholipase family protein [archaeon]